MTRPNCDTETGNGGINEKLQHTYIKVLWSLYSVVGVGDLGSFKN